MWVWQGISSYGGDPRVIASRDEMLRVKHRMSAALAVVTQQLHPLAFLHHTIAHLQFAVHYPSIAARLAALEWACQSSAESFLSEDARLAVHLKALETVLDDQPWLRALLRSKLANQVLTGGLIALGVGQFLNGRAATQLTRGLINAGPLLFGTGDGHDPAKNARDLGNWLLGREHLLKLGVETGIRVTKEPVISNNKIPKNIAGLTARLYETAGVGRPAIRVDRFEGSNGRTFVIYVPGTEGFALGGKKNAFDLNSAIHSFANDGEAAIDRGLRQVIQSSAITANDRVIFVGYSQGGMAAANLIAEQPPFKVAGLVSLGAPIGHIKLPGDVAVLALEHTNDMVPALSGQTNPLTSQWATVQREYPVATGHMAVESHELGAYLDTSRQVDGLTDAGVARIRGVIDRALAAGDLCESQIFEITRK